MKTMRKVLAIIIFVTVVFSNYSCSSDYYEDVAVEQNIMADEGDWGDDDLPDEEED